MGTASAKAKQAMMPSDAARCSPPSQPCTRFGMPVGDTATGVPELLVVVAQAKASLKQSCRSVLSSSSTRPPALLLMHAPVLALALRATGRQRGVEWRHVANVQ